MLNPTNYGASEGLKPELDRVIWSIETRTTLVFQIRRKFMENPIQKALKYKRDLNQALGRSKVQRGVKSLIAKHNKISPDTLKKHLRLLDLDDEIQDLISVGRISFGVACIIMQAPKSKQLFVAQRYIYDSLSRSQLQELVRDINDGKEHVSHSIPVDSDVAKHLEKLIEELGISIIEDRSDNSKIVIKSWDEEFAKRLLLIRREKDDFDYATSISIPSSVTFMSEGIEISLEFISGDKIGNSFELAAVLLTRIFNLNKRITDKKNGG